MEVCRTAPIVWDGKLPPDREKKISAGFVLSEREQWKLAHRPEPHLQSEGSFFQMFSLLEGLIIKKQSSPSRHNYVNSCTQAPWFSISIPIHTSLPLLLCILNCIRFLWRASDLDMIAVYILNMIIWVNYNSESQVWVSTNWNIWSCYKISGNFVTKTSLEGFSFTSMPRINLTQVVPKPQLDSCNE